MVIYEFLDFRKPKEEDWLIVIQATTPFTSYNDFMKLHEAVMNGFADSYISSRRVKKFFWSDNGSPLNYKLDNKPLRQDYNGILLETGAFYATSVKSFIDTGHIINGKVHIIETSEGSEIDIDEEKDWIVAEWFGKINGYF